MGEADFRNIYEYPIFWRVDIVFIFLFFLSFANSVFSTVFMLLLLYYWRYGVEGCIKALVLLTTRGIISPAVASGSGITTVKWAVLLGTSLWILMNAHNSMENKRKINCVMLSLMIFAGIVALSSMIQSSYPVTSLFKMISFALPFSAIIIGIEATHMECRWIDYFAAFFLLLFGISAVLIPFGHFRVTNEDFQGVFNHVNMLGIISAVFIAAFLQSSLFRERKIIRTGIVVAVLVMEYLSMSRTGMFSAVTVLITYYFTNAQPFSRKAAKLLFALLIILALYFIIGSAMQVSILDKAYDFIWKNSKDSIFDSRMEILTQAQQRFQTHKLLGSGFMVPFYEGIKDYSLKFDLIVEPSNLLWMLLSDTGIVGIILFGVLFFNIVVHGKWKRIHLLVGVFMVNMGEMVFFSSNNMSILLYFLIAVYMFGDYGSVVADV